MIGRIATIATFVVNYPTVGQFKFFTSSPDRPPGRITAVVKITTDNGDVGWGQCVPSPRWSYETIESVVTTINRYLAPELIHQEIPSVDTALSKMDRVIACGFARGQPIAKAGIDLALWDLYGKREQKPLHELWQLPTRDKVELSWTLDPPSLDHLSDEVTAAHSRGYRSFNLKVGRGVDWDVSLCRHFRSLAPHDHLWVDANGGYDLDNALSITPQLAELGVAAIEQPVPGNRPSWYRRLKQLGALPILMDETIFTAVELEEFHDLEMLDGVVLKVSRSGGLTESLRIAETAKRLGLTIYGSGLTDPDIALAASLQLFAACDLNYAAALNGPQFLNGSILREPVAIDSGCAIVPGGFGLGISVDDARLAAMTI